MSANEWRSYMNVYAVRVYKQGSLQGKPLYIPARSAEEAMDEVEARLGLEPPTFSIDNETGQMIVSGWHGFEFRARFVGRMDHDEQNPSSTSNATSLTST